MRRWTGLACGALAVAVLGGPPSAAAQDRVSVEATVEPARATVGDRITLTITARHPAGMQLAGPDDPLAFAPFDVIEIKPDTSRQTEDGVETEFVYVLAAFSTGRIDVPALDLTDESTADVVARVDPGAVTIESVLADGATPQLRGLRGPLETSAGPPAWIWAALVMAGFVALSLLTMALARVALRQPRSPAPLGRPAPLEVIARRELDALGTMGFAATSEDYGQLASCLRSYLSRRFAIRAEAMTSDELHRRLEAAGVDRWPARLAVNLLEQCEAVQYGRYHPARERAEADLAAAYEIVDATTPQETGAALTAGSTSR